MLKRCTPLIAAVLCSFNLISMPLLLTPSVGFGQEEPEGERALGAPDQKLPDASPKTLTFSVLYIAILLAVACGLAIGLGLAYKSARIGVSTACLVGGAALAISPVFGIAGVIAVHASQFVESGNNVNAADAATMSNLLSATLLLMVFMYASFAAFPFGVAAIIAAFLVKKPTS